MKNLKLSSDIRKILKNFNEICNNNKNLIYISNILYKFTLNKFKKNNYLWF